MYLEFLNIVIEEEMRRDETRTGSLLYQSVATERQGERGRVKERKRERQYDTDSECIVLDSRL